MLASIPHRSKISNADKMFGVSTKTGTGIVRLRAGNQWLHWSGGFLTDNPKHAWSGTVDQARKCRSKFDAAAGCRVEEVSSAHKNSGD